MRSGRIGPEDRVVWVGPDDIYPVGSSFKAREVTRTEVAIDLAEDGSHIGPFDPAHPWPRGSHVVSCREAADRGVEPWASEYARLDARQRERRRRRESPTRGAP